MLVISGQHDSAVLSDDLKPERRIVRMPLAHIIQQSPGGLLGI